MRSVLCRAALAAALLAAPAAAQTSPTTVPFSVSLRPAGIAGLPALQGFAAAQWNGAWVFVTGRRAGLHSLNIEVQNAFPPEQANDSIYVVYPDSSKVLRMSVRGLPDSLAEVLTVNNAQAYQDGPWLYLVGGYGAQAGTGAMRTMPYATALSVPGVIDAVRQRSPARLQAAMVRKTDARFRVTGGQLLKMDGLYYLTMGQLFDGLYSTDPGAFSQFTQLYTERITLLSITPPLPTDLSRFGVQTADTILQDPNDTGTSFHRRDLNVVGAFTPGGGRRLAVYGGVFLPGQDEGYRFPLYVGPNKQVTVDSSFAQATNQYDCGTLLLWSAAGEAMHTVLFGGIGSYGFDADSGRFVPMDRLPFVSVVSTITVARDGTTTQAAFADSLPGLLGSEARVLLDPAVAADSLMGIVYLDSLRSGAGTRVGWLYGGIHSQVPQTTDQARQTRATNLLFEIWITPGPAPATLLPTGGPSRGRGRTAAGAAPGGG